MRMSTKSRFAVQAMIDLALRERGRAGGAGFRSRQRQGGCRCPTSNRLFSRLRRAGRGGKHTGPRRRLHAWAGAATEAISAADIVNAVEDPRPKTIRLKTGGRMEHEHAICGLRPRTP